MEVNQKTIRDILDSPFPSNGVSGVVLKSIPSVTDEKTKEDLLVNAKTLEDLDQFRITKEKNIPSTPPMITIGDANVAAPHNLTPITAESKAGKTAITGVFIAGAISNDGAIDGLNDVTIAANPDGKAVIHFDTEQSEADQQYNLRTTLRRAHLDATPAHYRSYNIRTIDMKEYREFTNEVCRLCDERFKGIHLIVVDGGADYVTSVNDEAEANAIINFFISLAVTYNCAVILVVHLNENASKNGDTMPRGHLGRQAIRKGYCQLNITKDGDISTMQVLRARRAGSRDTQLVRYQFNKEKGYHVSVDEETFKVLSQNDKSSAKKKCELIAAKVFPPPTSLSHKDSYTKIMTVTGQSKDTAKRKLSDMLNWGLVEKCEDGFYRLMSKP